MRRCVLLKSRRTIPMYGLNWDLQLPASEKLFLYAQANETRAFPLIFSTAASLPTILSLRATLKLLRAESLNVTRYFEQRTANSSSDQTFTSSGCRGPGTARDGRARGYR